MLCPADMRWHASRPPEGCSVQWLVVRETDDDKTRARKKKLQKSHKSKLRFQQLDQEVKHRQDNWQNFKKGKGAKKKVWQLSPRHQETWLCVSAA